MYLHTYSKKSVSSSISKLFLVGLLYCTAGLTYAQTKITAQGTINIGHRDGYIKNTATQFVQLQTKNGESYFFDLNKFKAKSNIQLNDLLNNQVKIIFSISNDSSRKNTDLIETIDSVTPIPVLNSKTRSITKNINAYKTGNFPYAILMCGYKDSPAFDLIVGDSKDPNSTNIIKTPITVDSVNNMFVGPNRSLNYYWQQASFGKINITGSKAFGWYRLPYNKSWYTKNNPKGILLYRIHCMNAAIKNSFDSRKYYGIIFSKPISQDLEAVGFQSVNLPKLLLPVGQSSISNGCYGYPRDEKTKKCPLDLAKNAETELKARIDLTVSAGFNDLWGKMITAHEMGHTLGLPHSYFEDSFEDSVDSSGNKTGSQYINAFDVMSEQGAIVSLLENQKHLLPQYPIGYWRYKLGWFEQYEIATYYINNKSLSIDIETNSLELNTIPNIQNGNSILIPWRIILLKDKNNLTEEEYSIEVRGAKNALNKTTYFDNKLTEPVVIIHQHKTDKNEVTLYPSIPYKSTIVNPGQLKSNNSYTESVMLRQGEYWISPIQKSDNKRFKLTVNSINDTNANVTVETIN